MSVSDHDLRDEVLHKMSTDRMAGELGRRGYKVVAVPPPPEPLSAHPMGGKAPAPDCTYSYTAPLNFGYEPRQPTDWDARFLALAAHIASWSKDPSTRVGAVIVDGDRRIVSTGYNGPARGTSDAAVTNRHIKHMRTLHAEENAVLFARGSAVGCTLYVTHHPCAHCAAIIIQAGIKNVVWSSNESLHADWKDSCEIALTMFNEADIDWLATREQCDSELQPQFSAGDIVDAHAQSFRRGAMLGYDCGAGINLFSPWDKQAYEQHRATRLKAHGIDV